MLSNVSPISAALIVAALPLIAGCVSGGGYKPAD